MKATFLCAMTAASAFLLAGCSGSNPPSTSPATNATSSPVVQPEIYAQKKVDVSALTQAVQQYNAAEGHYPNSLQDLTPNYIAKIPPTPAGYKLNYDANNGTVTLVQQQ